MVLNTVSRTSRTSCILQEELHFPLAVLSKWISLLTPTGICNTTPDVLPTAFFLLLSHQDHFPEVLKALVAAVLCIPTAFLSSPGPPRLTGAVDRGELRELQSIPWECTTAAACISDLHTELVCPLFICFSTSMSNRTLMSIMSITKRYWIFPKYLASLLF